MLDLESGQRCSGRTTLLLKAVLASENAVFVVAYEQSKQRVLRAHPQLKNRCFTLADMEHGRFYRYHGGRVVPVIFDHHAIEVTFGEHKRRAQSYLIENEELKQACGAHPCFPKLRHFQFAEGVNLESLYNTERLHTSTAPKDRKFTPEILFEALANQSVERAWRLIEKWVKTGWIIRRSENET